MKNFRKSDILASLIIAEADALLLLFILKTIKVQLPPFLAFLDPFLPFLPLVLPILALLYILVGSFFKEKFSTIFQLFKFTLTGSLNTFIDFAVLNLLMQTLQIASGWYFSFFKLISFSCAAINSYFWNKFWTFKKKETKVGTKEFSQFYLITGISLLINVGIASLIVNVIGSQFGLSETLWANVGAFGGILCTFIWNFLGYKFIVFKK
jgi:putative flippase GtrA